MDRQETIMLRLTASIAVTAFALSAASGFAAPRTFVASNGNDSHSCSVTQPCRTIAAAIALADAGGEVIVLDSAGYGGFVVNKPVTVTASPGVYAGISLASGTAVIGIGGANASLRGLTINGQGADIGVLVAGNGGNITIENCIIINAGVAGVFFDAPNATLSIRNTTFRANADGILARLTTLGSGTVVVTDSVIADSSVNGLEVHASVSGSSLAVYAERVTVTNNKPLGTGFFAISDPGTNALVVVSNSVATGNKFGLATQGTGSPKLTVSGSTVTGNISEGLFNFGGELLSGGDNRVHDNNGGGSQTGGTIGALPPPL
jgi:Right handed beta helix region